MRRLFGEISRVLKPGGRVVITVLLLDHYRAGRARPSVFAAPSFDFDRDDPQYPGDVRSGSAEPGGPRAYRLALIEKFAAEAGLSLAGNVLPGLWSGQSSTWVLAHDVVLLRKIGTSQD